MLLLLHQPILKCTKTKIFCEVPNCTFELNVCMSVCEKTFYKKSITYNEFKKQKLKLP